MLRTISQETNILHVPSQFISFQELINSLSGTVCSNAKIEILICKTKKTDTYINTSGGGISLLQGAMGYGLDFLLSASYDRTALRHKIMPVMELRHWALHQWQNKMHCDES